MSLLDRISIDPDVVHGRPVIRGTRMRVADVLSLLANDAQLPPALARLLREHGHTAEHVTRSARLMHPIATSGGTPWSTTPSS